MPGVDRDRGGWFTEPVVAPSGLGSQSTSRARRGVDPAAWWAFAPVMALVPVWLVSLIPLWWLIDRFVSVGYPSVAIAHLALSVVLFWRPVQRHVLSRLLEVRTPTPEEATRLEAAWIPVERAHGHVPNRFVFAISDEDELNAFACGGHLLVISSRAVAELDTEELAGVLAHELAHHLGSHTVALTIAQWMSVPVLALAHLGWWLRTVAEAATATFTRRGSLVETLGHVAVAVLRTGSWILVAGVRVAQIVGHMAGRGAEFAADRRVAEMGLGRSLSRALRRVGDHGARPRSRWERLTASHPPARTRAARLDALHRRRVVAGSTPPRR